MHERLLPCPRLIGTPLEVMGYKNAEHREPPPFGPAKSGRKMEKSVK
jgi:hypothetical protein